MSAGAARAVDWAVTVHARIARAARLPLDLHPAQHQLVDISLQNQQAGRTAV